MNSKLQSYFCLMPTLYFNTAQFGVAPERISKVMTEITESFSDFNWERTSDWGYCDFPDVRVWTGFLGGTAVCNVIYEIKAEDENMATERFTAAHDEAERRWLNRHGGNDGKTMA